MFIGRSAKCGIVLNHPAVSSIHCRLSLDDHENAWLKDFSTNGTFVNTKPAGKENKMQVFNGDQISLIQPKFRAADIAFTLYLLKTSASSSFDTEFEAASDYKVLNLLGTGSFAEVRECVHRFSGERAAVKIIDKRRTFPLLAGRRRKSLLDEANIMEGLRHPNIVQIKRVVETPCKVVCVCVCMCVCVCVCMCVCVYIYIYMCLCV